MPHISVKMLKGRTEEQKQKLTTALAEAMKESLGVSDVHISLTIEDYSAKEWQGVFKEEITDKQKCLYKKPGYKPEDLL